MAKHANQPRAGDAVLGGQNPVPTGAAVLGGLQGVKMRLTSAVVEQQIAALFEALKYGESGLDLVIQALKDKSWRVQKAACAILQNRTEPRVQAALREYPSTSRVDTFVALARNGGVSDVDFLLQALEVDGNTATYKLVDFALGLVETPQGKDRIRHYLFNGTQMQRNYAALYFKRLGAKDVLAEAVKQGCIDRVQAFSK